MKKNLCKCPMLLTAVAFMVAVSAGFWSAAFAAPAFSQIDFVPRTGTEPYGITEDGSVIAGVFDPAGDQSQGFLDIEAFGFLLFGCSYNSEIYGICGVIGSFSIVGIYPGSHGFVWHSTGGGCTDIKYPNATLTYVYGINKSGQIVGGWLDASSYPIVHGFLRESDGSFTSFDYPYPNGALSKTVGYGINDAGQIVGYYSDASGIHGFLRESNGSFTSFDYPGAGSTYARGINDAGQIVGYYSDASGYHHGFLRNSNGNFSKIDAPGAGNTYAYGINDAGKIVGSYTSKNDPFQVIHGFLYGPK